MQRPYRDDRCWLGSMVATMRVSTPPARSLYDLPVQAPVLDGLGQVASLHTLGRLEVGDRPRNAAFDTFPKRAAFPA